MRYLTMLALLAATPATAKEFTLFIHEAPAALKLRTDAGPAGTAYWQGYAAIGGEMAKAGVLRGGSALEPSGSGRLRLGGYLVIDVADAAAARQWADRVPAAGGRVDVVAHAAARTGM